MGESVTQQHNLTIPQGTTWGVAWPIVDTEGRSVDLTGWSARSQVRSDVRTEDVLHEWSSEAGTAELDNSYVTLRVAPEVSTDWTWRDGVYDVELTSPDHVVYRVAEGRISVSPEVTR